MADAVIIVSAREEDGEVDCVTYKGKSAVPGFKAHLAADADMA